MRPLTPPSLLARAKRALAPSSASASDWPEALVLSTSPSMVIELLVKPAAGSALPPPAPDAGAPELGVVFVDLPLELLPQAASTSAKEAPSATNAVLLFLIVPPCRASSPLLAGRPIRLVHICVRAGRSRAMHRGGISFRRFF